MFFKRNFIKIPLFLYVNYITDAYQSEREIKIYVKNFYVLILRKCICLSSQTEFVINREKSEIVGKKAKLFEWNSIEDIKKLKYLMIIMNKKCSNIWKIVPKEMYIYFHFSNGIFPINSMLYPASLNYTFIFIFAQMWNEMIRQKHMCDHWVWCEKKICLHHHKAMKQEKNLVIKENLLHKSMCVA